MTSDRTTLLRVLEPGVVQEYLRRRGWRVVEARAAEQRYVVYERGGIAVDLPLHQTDRDYARRVEELITTLAAVDHVAADDLLDELGQPAFAPLEDVVVTGVVVRLEREAGDRDAPGEIEIVPTEPLPMVVGRVVVALNPTDYAEALQAHALGTSVRLVGTLEKRGRRWVLAGGRDFTREPHKLDA